MKSPDKTSRSGLKKEQAKAALQASALAGIQPLSSKISMVVTVVWYKRERGVGFVELENGAQGVLLTSTLDAFGYDTVNPGDKLKAVLDFYDDKGSFTVSEIDEFLPATPPVNDAEFDKPALREGGKEEGNVSSANSIDGVVSQALRAAPDIDAALLEMNIRAAFSAAEAGIALPAIGAPMPEGVQPHALPPGIPPAKSSRRISELSEAEREERRAKLREKKARYRAKQLKPKI